MTPIQGTARTSSALTQVRSNANEAVSAVLSGPPPLVGGMETILARMEIDRRRSGADTAASTVHAGEAKHDTELREAREAEARAEEASKHGGFWGSLAHDFAVVAEVAGVVAAVGSVVATGGASAPAIIALSGVALSASSPLVTKVTGSEKLGAAAMWTGLGLSLAAGGYTLFAGGLSNPTVSKTAATLTSWTIAAQGSATVVSGGATIVQKRYEGDVADEQANALAMTGRAKRTQQEVEDAIEKLKELEASVQRAIMAITQGGDAMDATKSSIVGHLGRSLGA